MPDWLCNFWRSDVPELAGKLKLSNLTVVVDRNNIQIDGVTEEIAREALRKAGTKLPVKTTVVSRA